MINCADIQNAYNKLYKDVRRYIWGFSAVEALADLEIACYQTCPDLASVKSAFNRFRQYAKDVLYDDEDMSKSFDKFESLIYSDDTVYANLNRVEEVHSYENNI